MAVAALGSGPASVSAQRPLPPAAPDYLVTDPRSFVSGDQFRSGELADLSTRVAELEQALQQNKQRPSRWGVCADAIPRHRSNELDDAWQDTHNEKWRQKWGGRLQGDYVTFPREPAGFDQQNYFEFRRIRFVSTGTGYGVYDYSFSSTSSRNLVD